MRVCIYKTCVSRLSIAIIHRQFEGHGALGSDVGSPLVRFLHLTPAAHQPHCEHAQSDEGEGEGYDPSIVLVTVDIILVVIIWKADWCPCLRAFARTTFGGISKPLRL